MFQNGIAEIIVGSNTITERRELKMRYDDALCAVSSCDEGVVPGSGIIYALISDSLTNDTIGNNILKNALIKPLEQIIINSALDDNVLKTIKNSSYQKLYNVKTDEYEKDISRIVCCRSTSQHLFLYRVSGYDSDRQGLRQDYLGAYRGC